MVRSVNIYEHYFCLLFLLAYESHSITENEQKGQELWHDILWGYLGVWFLGAAQWAPAEPQFLSRACSFNCLISVYQNFVSFHAVPSWRTVPISTTPSRTMSLPRNFAPATKMKVNEIRKHWWTFVLNVSNKTPLRSWWQLEWDGDSATWMMWRLSALNQVRHLWCRDRYLAWNHV